MPSDLKLGDESAKPLAPGLYLVATPIGNWATLRCARSKFCAALTASPAKTRAKPKSFLNHFQIDKKTVSCHEHNERSRPQN